MVEEQLLPTWLESLGVRCTLRKQKSRFDSGEGLGVVLPVVIKLSAVCVRC